MIFAALSLLLAAVPAAGATIRDCPDCDDMVVISAGTFLMGSSGDERTQEGVPAAFGDREEPRHRVTLRHAFAIGRDEVSRRSYARFVAETRRPPPPSCATYRPGGDGHDIQRAWGDVAGASWDHPGFAQTDDDPAVCIAFDDAQDYAAWLSRVTGHRYRLPSEAEWEYAARGGTNTARPWGDAVKPLCASANVMTSATEAAIGWPAYDAGKLVCVSPHGWTSPAGTYPANGFGTRDMLGNVWEWVADCRHPNYAGAPDDGLAWAEPKCAGHPLRGGAFHSETWLVRPATRFWLEIGPFGGGAGRSAMTGMRLVRELDR